MSDPTFQIPRDLIDPIIEKQVATAIAGALDGRAALVEQAITKVFSMKVDDKGNPSHYSHSRPWIDWAVGDAIQRATRAALSEALVKQHDAVKAEITRQLQRKNSPLARKLVACLVGEIASTSDYNWAKVIRVSVDGKEQT